MFKLLSCRLITSGRYSFSHRHGVKFQSKRVKTLFWVCPTIGNPFSKKAVNDHALKANPVFNLTYFCISLNILYSFCFNLLFHFFSSFCFATSFLSLYLFIYLGFLSVFLTCLFFPCFFLSLLFYSHFLSPIFLSCKLRNS